MRIETALNRRNTAIQSLRSLYETAKFYGPLSSQMNEDKAKIRRSTLAKCPHWVIAYFDGYEKALIDALYRDSLMFGGFYEGKFYSTHSNRADYYGNNGIEPSEYADNGKVSNRGHYWLTTKEPKPYFIG
jgi:hypothetical protein